jgi:hypothetical protein
MSLNESLPSVIFLNAFAYTTLPFRNQANGDNMTPKRGAMEGSVEGNQGRKD